VDTVRLYPAGETLAARLDNLGWGIALVRAAGSSLSRTGVLPAPASREPGYRVSALAAASAYSSAARRTPRPGAGA